MCAEEHQVLALLGHNGAGKTTTINMLIGLLEPQEGKRAPKNMFMCVCGILIMIKHEYKVEPHTCSIL